MSKDENYMRNRFLILSGFQNIDSNEFYSKYFPKEIEKFKQKKRNCSKKKRKIKNFQKSSPYPKSLKKHTGDAKNDFHDFSKKSFVHDFSCF